MEQVYSYSAPSRCLRWAQGWRLLLATSAGLDHHPRLFEGQLRRPRLAALALLSLARVARTPVLPNAGPAVDPVVTCDLDRLDLEALSPCAGIYIRLELMPSVLVGNTFDAGRASLDLNLPVRAALAKVADPDLLQLSIGAPDLALGNLGRPLERHLTLEPRWLVAFGRARQLSDSPLRQRLTAYDARRFTRSLEGFEDLAPYVTGLYLQAPDDQLSRAWTLELDGLRIHLVRSFEVPSPFGAGESGLLRLPVRTYAWWELGVASKVRVIGSSD